MSPVDEGVLHAWLDGALPDEEAARVAQLVREDAAWAEAAAEARGLIANASRVVRALDDGPVGAASVRSVHAAAPARVEARGWRLARRAAALAAVVTVAVVGRAAWRSTAGVAEAPMPPERATAETPLPAATPVRAPEGQASAPAETRVAAAPAPAAVARVAPKPEAVSQAVPDAVPEAVPDAVPDAVRDTKREATAQIVEHVGAARRASVAGMDMVASPAAAPTPLRDAALPLDWMLRAGCVMLLVQWDAEDGLPAAKGEVLVESLPKADGDTLRLSAPMPSQRADGTSVPTRAMLALHRTTGRGVATLVHPDGRVVRRGVVERARRCP